MGQITVDDVMEEVREQSERDYQLASGLSQDVETDDNVMRQTSARLPWLLIGTVAMVRVERATRAIYGYLVVVHAQAVSLRIAIRK